MRAIATLAYMPDVAKSEDGGAQSDRDLVQEARKGSHAAFEALVRRYSDRAYRAAYRVVRDETEAEDVLQEALIKAYRALPNFESRSSFYTWLYRIVVNLALDRRRRSKASVSLEWDDNVSRQIDARAAQPVDQDPELASMRTEVRKMVGEGIQGLPDGQREVLLLREVDGLSYEEIAETMQISKGTVMSRLHYARKKLVAFLGERGIAPEDVA